MYSSPGFFWNPDNQTPWTRWTKEPSPWKWLHMLSRCSKIAMSESKPEGYCSFSEKCPEEQIMHMVTFWKRWRVIVLLLYASIMECCWAEGNLAMCYWDAVSVLIKSVISELECVGLSPGTTIHKPCVCVSYFIFLRFRFPISVNSTYFTKVVMKFKMS